MLLEKTGRLSRRVRYTSYGTTVANAWKKVLEYTGEDAVEKAERNQHLAQELTKLWEKTPAEVKVPITGLGALGGCAFLAYTVAKASVASAGTAVPAWVTWLGSPAGKTTVERTCGAAVVIATAVVVAASESGGGSGGSGGSGSGGGSQQPTPNQQDDPDGDYDGDGKTTAEEAHEAALRYEAGELTGPEYNRIIHKYFCDQGDSCYCNK